MKTKLIALSVLAASAAAIALPSHADNVNVYGEVGYIPPVPSGPSNVTREQVVAELMKAREAERQPAPPPEPSTVKREDVVAELREALRSGTMPPTGEVGETGYTVAAVPVAQPVPMAAMGTLASR